MEQEKTTIQAAAKALGVTTKTIQRYLSNGTLSKIKDGNRTYILIDEIRTLRQGQAEGQKNSVRTEHKDRDSDTITIKLTEYKGLLQEVGHYKGLIEGQTRNLLEYKGTIEAKEQELTAKDKALAEIRAEAEARGRTLADQQQEIAEAKATIAKARSELQGLLTVQQDAEAKTRVILDQEARIERKERELSEIRAEVERLKLPFWKRWFK
ncbi:MAG: helix-turn-helix domain-containing protein [bacterium]